MISTGLNLLMSIEDAHSAAIPVATHLSFDFQAAYLLPSSPDNSMAPSETVRMLNNWGIADPSDLCALDDRHIVALAQQLKIAPRKKFMSLF